METSDRDYAMIKFAMFLLSTLLVLPGPADTLTFVHEERSIQPGEMLRFRVRSSRPLVQLSIKAFDRIFPAFPETGESGWTGLVGIDLDTKPGTYQAELFGVDRAGDKVSAQATLNVNIKSFPTRELTVDEKYVAPPAKVLARIEQESKRVDSIFAAIRPERLWNNPFRLPVPGPVISVFGKRSVYNRRPRSPHAGVDFRGAKGTPIRAPNAGIIVLADNLYYSGNTVIIDHGMGLYSYLGHMSSISVKEGDPVNAGDIVGKVGSTGVATGPHLHWTIRLVRTRVDPLSVVNLLGPKHAD
jgi:murein DD-endopeptidase MepM/ murein hydrolase activator NlpD